MTSNIYNQKFSSLLRSQIVQYKNILLSHTYKVEIIKQKRIAFMKSQGNSIEPWTGRNSTDEWKEGERENDNQNTAHRREKNWTEFFIHTFSIFIWLTYTQCTRCTQYTQFSGSPIIFFFSKFSNSHTNTSCNCYTIFPIFSIPFIVYSIFHSFFRLHRYATIFKQQTRTHTDT